MEQNNTRLNKKLSLILGLSRRQADDLISDNKVMVNQQIARLGQRVKESDLIEVNGTKIAAKVEYKTIIFNKPVGFTCSRASQGGDKTIYDILPKDLFHLKPVGRLDKNSSGALLLTNNGDLAFELTHPKFHKTKNYTVEIDKDLEPLHQQMISDYGVNLVDGKSRLNLTRANDQERRTWLVSMHEGRNRQIRRTFYSLGYDVLKLHRSSFDKYSVDDIPSGEYKDVSIS